MRNPRYRRCAVDGELHHPDEIIRLPADEPYQRQKNFCLDHAQAWLRGEIAAIELKTVSYRKRRVA